MSWWLWLIIVLVVVIVAVVAFAGLQASRRRGGVISSRDLTKRGDGS